VSGAPEQGWDRPPDDVWPKSEGSYIGRHWNGELALGVSFWVNGFLLNIAIGIVAFVAVYAVASAGSKDAVIALFVFLAVFSIALSVWQLVGIWRSAEQHKLHIGRKGWATAAQVICVLAWIGLVVNTVGWVRDIDEINRLY
jgi:hypothetical protein